MPALLQESFLTLGLTPYLLRLLHWQVSSLPLTLTGKPDLGQIIAKMRKIIKNKSEDRFITAVRAGLLQWLSSKESACSAGDTGSVPGSGRSLEEGMAIHSRVLARKTPWTEKPGCGGYSPWGCRVRHDRSE